MERSPRSKVRPKYPTLKNGWFSKRSRRNDKRASWTVRRFGRAGVSHATATGSLHSDRAVLDHGAVAGADRGLSHGRTGDVRSAVYGDNLLRNGVRAGSFRDDHRHA